MSEPFRLTLADAEAKASRGQWIIPSQQSNAGIVGPDGKPIERDKGGLTGILRSTYAAWESYIPTFRPERVREESVESVEYAPIEPTFTPTEYRAPSFTCREAVIRVTVDLDNHEHGDFRRATAWQRAGEETIVRFGCQKRRIGVWRRAGHRIIADHYSRPRYEAWQLDADEVLAREVPDYVDKRNDRPRGPFDYCGALTIYYDGLFTSRNPEVDPKHRRTLTAEQRRARADVIVQERREKMEHANQRVADIVRLLPELLDRVEAAIAEARA